MRCRRRCCCCWTNSLASKEAVKECRILEKVYNQKTPSEWEKIVVEDRNLRIKHWEENELKLLLQQDCKCAESAISLYNSKHGSDYEVVETLKSYLLLFRGCCYHCNFKAQSKTARTGPKLFFAELSGGYTAESCCILDDHEKIVHGCEFCPDLISHPANPFQVGHKSAVR